MKTLKEALTPLAEKICKELTDDFVTFVCRWDHYKEIPATHSSDLVCEDCGQKTMKAVIKDPKIGIYPKCALCIECPTPAKKNQRQPEAPVDKNKLSIEQKKAFWCEIHKIPISYHYAEPKNLSNELFQVLKNIAKFNKKSLFVGPPGVGKTYAAIALCLGMLPITTSISYFTAVKFQQNYLDKVWDRQNLDFEQAMKDRKILIIDELANTELKPQFMEFLHDIIDYRLNDPNTCTIIITNYLDKLTSMAKDALSDRIKTFETIEFDGRSLRR